MSTQKPSERHIEISPDTLKSQSRAADPNRNVWVSANAGAGKTFVLTRRVMRILLTGVAPENILCLTFTKAAAAEMQARVAAALADWTALDDDDLKKSLHELTTAPVDDKLMARARTLFASALETPGGLKIKTIHAFCEAVLHRFPLEADIPVRFSVIEEDESIQLLAAAQNQVLAQGLAGASAVALSVDVLFQTKSDHQIKSAVGEALQIRDLPELVAKKDLALENLRKHLSLSEADFATDWQAEVLQGSIFTEQDCTFVRETFAGQSGDMVKALEAVHWPVRTREEHLLIFLIKKDFSPRKRLLTADQKKISPDILSRAIAEQERLIQILDKAKCIETYQTSKALLDLIGAIHEKYVDAKRARARLDYDDLIKKLLHLLRDKTSRDWVRYKLDAQITHILVDESQDTNGDQWTTIELLIEEFFSGEGAVGRQRSIFAVGDEKQSIYSFQGAQPDLFATVRKRTAVKAKNAAREVEQVSLDTSFRTLSNILMLVDKVAESEMVRTALLSENRVHHRSARPQQGGTVTLWPLIEREKTEKADDRTKWPLDPEIGPENAEQKLAKRIVTEIAHWLRSNRPLEHRNRAISADDIMILVQRRGVLYRHLILELKRQQIPTPGADKIPVSNHIAVQDLLALVDFLLNPRDDLSLATILRSPLYALSEETLADLAINRGRNNLFHQLRLFAQEPVDDQSQKDATIQAEMDEQSAAVQFAFAELSELRRTLDFQRPFEFFANLLYARGGLKRFHARLGAEIDDALLEFLQLALAHEQSEQPSLTGFSASMRAAASEIKRDMSETQGVRVLTVHGAKGLESPIVILAEAGYRGTNKQTIVASAGEEPFFVYSPNKTGRPNCLKEDHFAQLTAKSDEEYWRKLYVGMTRAEDELYITGTEKAAGSWFNEINQAHHDQWVPHAMQAFSDIEALSFPQPVATGGNSPSDPQRIATTKAQTSVEMAQGKPITPAHRQTNKATMQRAQRPTIYALSPSTATPIVSEAASPHMQEALANSSLDDNHFADNAVDVRERAETLPADMARRRGIALHALLQHMAPLSAAERQLAGPAALQTLLPEAKNLHPEILAKAQNIFDGPDAHRLFSESSRAEVPIAALLKKGEKLFRLSGRIDRLIIENDQVTIVDFKSDAHPPKNRDAVAPAYQTQLALYALTLASSFPRHKICAALYWTTTESLMIFESQEMANIINQYEMAQKSDLRWL